MSGRLVVILYCLFSIGVQAQDNPWLFPIKPGQINSISGSVGELRNTHFHTGLDIKTEGVTGLPVYASGDGYISRISVSPGGYGHALYIQHTNGYTTVYAHLERFAEPYKTYIRNEQYRSKTFALNRYPSKDKFPVKKGDVIAYSGNTGSSAGPHLHWDLRDPYQRPVNSLSYKFDEVRDTREPIVRKIAFRCMDINSRINGEFGRFEFPVYKSGDSYTISVPVALAGNIGIEILAWDKLDDSYNNCGISEFEVFNDEHSKFKGVLETLSFARQRSIYTFYNYQNRMATGNKFTKLYIDDGNDLGFYDESAGSGILNFQPGENKKVKILLKDSYGNTSMLNFENSPGARTSNGTSLAPGFSLDGNIMKFVTFTADNEVEAEAIFNLPEGKTRVIQGETEGFHKSLFLYDLRDGLPVSITINDSTFKVPYNQVIPPGRRYTYFSEEMDILFAENSLFDTLYLASEYKISENGSEVFEVNNTNDPINRPITITLKPTQSYDESTNSVYSMDQSGNLYYEGGEWEEGKIHFRTSYFSKYTIAQDTVPPVIKEVTVNRNDLRFRVYDQMSGIQYVKMTVDNEWVLMHHDPKTQRIWSEKKEKDSTFSGDVLLEITDQQGNISTFKTSLK